MLKLYLKCEKCKRKMQPIVQIQHVNKDAMGGVYECPVCHNRVELNVIRCVFQ